MEEVRSQGGFITTAITVALSVPTELEDEAEHTTNVPAAAQRAVQRMDCWTHYPSIISFKVNANKCCPVMKST